MEQDLVIDKILITVFVVSLSLVTGYFPISANIVMDLPTISPPEL